VLPGPQSSHAVAPLLPWKLPSGQTSQSWLRSAAANVPLAQAVGDDAPAKQMDPAGHAVQLAALARPSVAPYDPASHGSGIEDPSAQYEPEGQSTHAVPYFAFR